MMTDLGHEVFLYGGTQNEARVKEFVTVVSDENREKWFGSYNWDKEVFPAIGWDPQQPWWHIMNGNAIREIYARAQKGDFVGIIAGRCQEVIAKALPELRPVEWGVGYEGILDGFRVFESYAWKHYLYGKKNVVNGCFFDAVIPNSFEPEEIAYSAKKDDYLLYLGRLTPRKGLHVVEMLAKKGHRILTAGQGEIRIDGAEHVGVVRGEQKRQLLANARAVLVPTFYIEPFGGVAVEAMLSGTPVITTDFGAFTETVEHGVTGYRCNTLSEFYKAANDVRELDPVVISHKASYYLTSNIAHQYDKYFRRLQTLDNDGWYAE